MTLKSLALPLDCQEKDLLPPATGGTWTWLQAILSAHQMPEFDLKKPEAGPFNSIVIWSRKISTRQSISDTQLPGRPLSELANMLRPGIKPNRSSAICAGQIDSMA
jgi:hypothetical protein